MVKKKSKIKIIPKIIALLILSCVVHFLYDWFGFEWLTLIAPTGESVFQHIRIFFTAYLIFSLFEYNYIYKATSYWTSRFLLLIITPWVMIMIFLLPQSFTGKMPSELLEVVWGITSTALVWIPIVLLEKDFEKIKYSQVTKVVIAVLFVVLLLSSVIFTFNLPVYDIFAEPVTLY